MKLEASFLEDAYPGVDFWEVEKTFELKIRVIAEAETPEEEPSVSFARGLPAASELMGSTCMT